MNAGYNRLADLLRVADVTRLSFRDSSFRTVSDRFDSFDLSIERVGETYRAQVTGSPVGSRAPIAINPANLGAGESSPVESGEATRGTRRPIDRDDLRRLGERLFRAVFVDTVAEAFRASVRRLRRDSVGLRVCLKIDRVPELASLPWEAFWDPADRIFLADQPDLLVIRVPGWTAKAPVVRPADSSPLRVLALMPEPPCESAEWLQIEDELAPVLARGTLQAELLRSPTLNALKNRIDKGPCHVLHIVAQGGSGVPGLGGVLMLEDGFGGLAPVSGDDLARALEGQAAPCLVVLNTYHSARVANVAFDEMAQHLLGRRIPVVVAMRTAIGVAARATFAATLYREIAFGRTVEAAMIEARRTLSLGEYRAEWAKPVLYARGANVRILEVASEVGSSMPVRHATLQTAKVGHSESESELFETTQTEERPISVFISYSHRDETLCAQLEAHLALLRRENRISIWNARQIRGGEAWAERVSENLRTADLVLLLVSADFMNSDYCYETEMRYALRRHNEGRTRVIPIVLRKCDWRTAEFAKLQALPKGGCPVMSWGDPDDAWTDVAKRLRAIVDERRASGGLREPKPRYPNERVCNWSRQLKRAYKRLEKVTIAGSGAEKVKNEIDELRYRLREGGLVAGDYLAGGRFTLIDTIGSGGFATVWKAYDRHRRMTVALKVLHAQYARDASRRQRFFRGARHMAELRHPGIVRVIEDKARDGRFHFFVMEFVDDADLYRAVRDGWCPDIDARLRLILEVGEALNFAHEHGVIHRDVKPQNVLIDGTRRARLTDFDLVRAIDSSAGTRTGSMLGTWIYAAPEMMSDAKEAGVAADIYGLGMTAVFAVYGRDLPSNVVRDAPGFVNGLDIDEQVRSVLAQAVAWEPAERFISVVDFCRALRESLVEPDSQPFSPNRVTSVIGGHRGLATTQQTRSKTTMTRRWTGRMNGERYLGNSNTKEVHDLDNEKTQCQIDEILQAGHEIPFKTLQAALDAGYDRGYWCLGGSKR